MVKRRNSDEDRTRVRQTALTDAAMRHKARSCLRCHPTTTLTGCVGDPVCQNSAEPNPNTIGAQWTKLIQRKRGNRLAASLWKIRRQKRRAQDT